MGYNPIQDRVDQLLKELNTKPEDKEPQIYSRKTIKEFLLEEITMLTSMGVSESAITEKRKKVMAEIERIYAMTKGEQREFFAAKDRENRLLAKEYNERKVFEECLRREITLKNLSATQAATLKRERVTAYENGKYDYDQSIKTTVRIMMEHADAQLPEEVRVLKSEVSIPTVQEKIDEIENRGNQLVDGPVSNLVLKPKNNI